MHVTSFFLLKFPLRFQDFIVNEVNTSGNMVYLSKEALNKKEEKIVKEKPSEKKLPELTEDAVLELSKIFVEEDFKHLREYINEIN